MNHCLRCNGSCDVTSLFCDRCRAALELPEPAHAQSNGSGASPLSRESEEVALPDRATQPVSVVAEEVSRPSLSPRDRLTPPPDLETLDTQPVPALPTADAPPDFVPASDPAEQALHKLNDAARLIAAEEPQAQARVPRASRLAPFYDVSADIRRDSTPLPRTDYSTQPARVHQAPPSSAHSDANSEHSASLPDLWPWLSDTDDELEQDLWSNHTDPLKARRLPTSAQTGAHDFVRLNTLPFLQQLSSWRLKRLVLPSHGRWRVVFMGLLSLALIALMLDAVLVLLTVNNPFHSTLSSSRSLPTMTLDHNVLQYGQKLTISIRNFTPNALVSLTRDIDVPLVKSTEGPLLRVDDHGTKTITITIDNSWDPGLHSLQAEDSKLRFTANASLRINAGPTRPAHLVLSTTTLDLGAAYQGANTVQPLTLQNGGSGVISWSATSDQPWLTLSPARGEFSDSVQISVGGSRVDLAPQDYTGTITITANGEPEQRVSVTMTVRPLPENVGAVLAVSPAALAFSATDGGADPDDQFLVVRNSGTQPLYWTIQDDKNVPQGTFITADYILDANWLNPEHTSGIVQPQSQSTIRVSVHSAALLPGTYTRTLLFAVQAKHQALNSPTPVNVSLTVQRSCGINVNSYVMRFTAIAQRSNPSPQSLSLTASDSCEETIPWSATSSERWLTLTPAAGKVSVAASSVLTVNVDITGLKPGDYTALILLVAGRSMYSIPIELKVQQPPTPTSPVLGAAPLSLNFGATMGQTGQAGQTVTLTNTGGGPMRWSTVVNELASTWLAASPSGGTINPGQTAQLTVNVSAGSLSSGTYAGQVEIHAFDTNDAEISGSPQIVSVSFVVRPPCTLSAPSSKSLSFTESDGGSAIAPQSISFSASGTCDWPLTWSASVQTANADWLKLTPVSGSLTNSAQPDALTFSVDRASLTSTSARRVSVQLSVVDKSGQAVQGGTQTIQIALVKPCGLVPSTNALSFTTTQGQGAGAQTISLDTVGSCKLPFAWSAGADDGNKNWLALSATSGTLDGDTGGLDVSVASTALAPGNYSATITLSGQDSSGAIVRAVTVMVSLTVNGFTLSGTVNACPDTSCASPPALANATVTLKDAGGATIRTTMADAQGHYTFTNVAAGTYSLSASGGNYAGSTGQITVSGDTTMNINTTAPTSSPTP